MRYHPPPPRSPRPLQASTEHRKPTPEGTGTGAQVWPPEVSACRAARSRWGTQIPLPPQPRFRLLLEYQAPLSRGLAPSQFFSRDCFHTLTSRASRGICTCGPGASADLCLHLSCQPLSWQPCSGTPTSRSTGKPETRGPQPPCEQCPQTGRGCAEPACK